MSRRSETIGAVAGFAMFLALQSRFDDERRYLLLAVCVGIGILIGGLFDMRRR